MITSLQSDYLVPAKNHRYLSVLMAINTEPNSSQHRIGRDTGLSSSMVNNYIRSFREEGLITINGATNRSRSYHLTEIGRQVLTHSVLEYSAEIVRLYGAVKREIATILNGFYQEGIRTVVLFGVAETAEVVFAAMKETSLVTIGVVDSDGRKQGQTFNGLTIQVPEKVNEIKPDAIVITSFGRQEEIHAYVRELVRGRLQIKRLSDIGD
ncbi:MAG: winged helix-turn-helix transcriptional regulator [Desulfobacterales bacterium]|nr:winged helix-turn-helix transcriptional regulator [Desulfobacterales bacterium]